MTRSEKRRQKPTRKPTAPGPANQYCWFCIAAIVAAAVVIAVLIICECTLYRRVRLPTAYRTFVTPAYLRKASSLWIGWPANLSSS